MAFHIKSMWQKSKTWYILSLNNPKFKGKQDWVNRLFTRGDLNFCRGWDDLQDKCFLEKGASAFPVVACAQSVKEGAWDTRAKQGNTTNNHCKYCHFFVFVFVPLAFGWSGNLRDSDKVKNRWNQANWSRGHPCCHKQHLYPLVVTTEQSKLQDCTKIKTRFCNFF